MPKSCLPETLLLPISPSFSWFSSNQLYISVDALIPSALGTVNFLDFGSEHSRINHSACDGLQCAMLRKTTMADQLRLYLPAGELTLTMNRLSGTGFQLSGEHKMDRTDLRLTLK